MTIASEILENSRQQRAYEEFKHAWWWFDNSNKEHIHEFSAAWEILRRTNCYRKLYEHMLGLTRGVDRHSLVGFLQAGQSLAAFRELLPKSPPAPRELRDIVERWQTMIGNGWHTTKTYIDACKHASARITAQDGKIINIPPTFGLNNRGIPVILPRQVISSGHTTLFVELCDLTLIPNQPPALNHLAGSYAPTEMLAHMHRLGKSFGHELKGQFIAFQFCLHHPPQALRCQIKPGLDRIEQSQAWQSKFSLAVYFRGRPAMVSTLTPFEVIAFFPADNNRKLIESGFRSLIRTEEIKRHLPRIRKEWIAWEILERAKYAPNLTQEKIGKQASDAWDEEETCGKPTPQSNARPIRPLQDLSNLACADYGPFYTAYKRNRSKMPPFFPQSLKNDPDFNGRVKTGLRLVKSVDDLFLPFLNLPTTRPA